MAHGQPDFWTATITGMPTIGEGQVAWFQAETAIVAAGSYGDLLNFVVPDDKELHVCSGTVSCDARSLQRYELRTTPAATWESPTSHIDPDKKWFREEKAYDNDVTSYAYTRIGIVGWTSYLILLINEVSIDKIRFFAWYQDLIITKIDIDVHYGAAFHDVYEGAYADREWVEKDIPGGAQLISKVRIRFYNAVAYLSSAALYEFQFNTSEVTPQPQEGIYFDTNVLIPYQPQAPYLVEAGATFVVRVYNDDDLDHNMSAALAGFLQSKV